MQAAAGARVGAVAASGDGRQRAWYLDVAAPCLFLGQLAVP